MESTLDAAEQILVAIEGRLAEIHALGDLPVDLRRELVEAGSTRLHLPRSHGGMDAPLRASMELLEAVARVDASVAWQILGACEMAPLLTRLPSATFDAVYSAGPDLAGAAMLAPKGTAVETAGGYLVRGRWPNVTGCAPCVWLCGVCMVVDRRGEIRRRPSGAPLLRALVFPRANATLVDTWHTVGLQAAPGHDVVVDDIFVPADRSFDLFAKPNIETALGVLPMLSIFSLHAGAVALGVAGAALDLVSGQGGDSPVLSPARVTLARARRALQQLARRLTAATAAGGPLELELRVGARATGSWVIAAAGSVVATALGTRTAVDDDHEAHHEALARRFRDIHAVTQHAVLMQEHLSRGSASLVGAELAAV